MKYWILSLMLVLTGLAQERVRSLEEFGDISTVAAAEATLATGIAQLMAAGGGIIIVPPDAPGPMRIVNNSQTDRNGPGVTVVDYRGGFIGYEVPPMGKHQTGVWAGHELKRVVNVGLDQNTLPFQGVHATEAINNYVISGASSYMASLTRPVKAGQDQRVYVDLIRGIYVGQYLTVTSSEISYAPPYDRIHVKSIGWDDEAQCCYFTADFEYDHPVGALAYNKHVVNSLNINGYSNADNQSMELNVHRSQYGVGDSFVISGLLRYQSSVFSGFGDEGAIILNAESVSDLVNFHSTVESVNWAADELVYAPGKAHPHTLAMSRPLINLNQAKWITAGKVYVVNASSTWRGQSYPGHIGGPANVFNYQGGAILGDPDCPWTADIVGRYFALTDDSEVILPDEKSSVGGYANWPRDRPTRRWYRIMAFEGLADGWKRLKILRVRWSAVAAGAPRLFLDENYTRDGHDVPLSYAIAPGALVYDISRGWADTWPTGGVIEAREPRTLKLTPHRDRGTAFDFEPGDEVEQAIGPDPWVPHPIRVRQFDQLPGTLGGDTILIGQYGRVQVPSALTVTSLTRRMADIDRRKDRKPAFSRVIQLDTVCDIGLEVSGATRNSAIMMRQPEGPQPVRWQCDDGTNSAIYAEPSGANRGDFILSGGDLRVMAHGLNLGGGISQTGTAAVNLRGIDVAVPEGAARLEVAFPEGRPEADGNYSLTVQPNWFCQDRVAQKTPTGFVVEFSAAAPAGATLDWQLIR